MQEPKPQHPSVPNLKPWFEQIFRLLVGDDYDLRRDALIALSRLRGQIAAEILFERYRSDNLEDYLTKALVEADPNEAAKAFLHALGDLHLEVRIRAAEALAASPDDTTIHVLTQAVEAYLQSLSGMQVKQIISREALLGAITALGAIGTPICLALLQKLVLHEPNEKVRATAVATLGAHMTETLLPMYQALLKDKDARVRANAIEGLQNIANASIIAILQPYLYDSHQRVRANAARAIWKYGDFDVSITIKEMLADADKQQRVSALYAIGEIKLDVLRRAVIEGLKDPDPDIRRNAVIALRKFANKSQSLELIPMLNDADTAVRIQAAVAIGKVFAESGIRPIMLRLQRETEIPVKVALLEILGDIGNDQVLTSVAECLEDEDERVNHAALDAIHKIQPQNPTPGMVLSLRKMLQSAPFEIRAHVIRVLWGWGEHDILDKVLEFLEHADLQRQRIGLACSRDILALVAKDSGAIRSLFESVLKEVAEASHQILHAGEAGKQAEHVRTLFQQAQEALRQELLEQAQDAFVAILAINEAYMPARVGLAEIAVRLHDDVLAEQRLRAILEQEPNLLKAHYLLGQLYIRRQDWAQAAESLQTVVKLHPKLVQAYFLLAEALEKLQHYEAAAKVLSRLKTLAPGNGQVLQRLARVLFLHGKIPLAVNYARASTQETKLSLSMVLILAVGDCLDGHLHQGAIKFLQCLHSLPSSSVINREECLILIPRAMAILEAQQTSPAHADNAADP